MRLASSLDLIAKIGRATMIVLYLGLISELVKTNKKIVIKGEGVG